MPTYNVTMSDDQLAAMAYLHPEVDPSTWLQQLVTRHADDFRAQRGNYISQKVIQQRALTPEERALAQAFLDAAPQA